MGTEIQEVKLMTDEVTYLAKLPWTEIQLSSCIDDGVPKLDARFVCGLGWVIVTMTLEQAQQFEGRFSLELTKLVSLKAMVQRK